MANNISPKTYFLLIVVGLAMALFVASFQAFPGYMDSDYYFAGGIQLTQGKGFNEPYIWNYLDDPTGVPHPSHSYWMPLASILSALGMWLTRSSDYAAGRLAFIAIAAVTPAVTARLAFAFSGRMFAAIISGLLAVFSIYYAPFLPVTDNYGVYIVLGATFMLLVVRASRLSDLGLGIVAGAMNLARSDGILWLALGALGIIARAWRSKRSLTGTDEKPAMVDGIWLRVGLLVAGFLLITSPWFLRNWQAYGAIRAPGAERLLWLTTYDEIFTYPPGSLTAQNLWQHGVVSLLAVRLAALRWNLMNAFAAQAGVFLGPFILVGAWQFRRDQRVQLAVIGWVTLLAAMTLAFPAVGARGGWFHAGAGFQAVWWCLAPLGLERLVAAARARNLFTPRAPYVFGSALVGIAAVMTAYILSVRVMPAWGEGEDRYPPVDRRLVTDGALPQDLIMIRNPPGYFIMTGRPAIVIPYADSAGILAAAQKYGARYLAIEELGAAGPIRAVYENLNDESLEFLGEVDGTRIFRIR